MKEENGGGEEKRRIRRTTAGAVLSHETGTAGRPGVTVDAFAGEVGRVYVRFTIVVGVPLAESQRLAFFILS